MNLPSFTSKHFVQRAMQLAPIDTPTYRLSLPLITPSSSSVGRSVPCTPSYLNVVTTMFLRSRHLMRVRLLARATAFFASAFGSFASAQTGSIAGTVLSNAERHAVAQAFIELTDIQQSTRSDSAGNFELTGVAQGSHKMLVRQVGFKPFTKTISVGMGQRVDANVVLTKVSTTLDKVDVNAKSLAPYNPRLAAFEERRRMGLGKFVTAEVFEREDGRPISSFLQRTVPGVHVVMSNEPGSARYLASTRLGSTANRPCYIHVVLNDISVYTGFAGEPKFNIDELDTKRVIGFEWYSVANTPPQFNLTGASQCGTAVIWTK